MSRGALLFVAPALGVLAWHGYQLIDDGTHVAYRVLATVCAVAAAGWSATGSDKPRTALRVAAALAVSVALWLAVLEWAVARQRVYALGFLLMVAAALVQTTILLAVHAPRPRPAANGLALRAAFAVSVVALSLCGIEAAFSARLPPMLYDAVPDDPGSPAFFKIENGILVGRPGFRGQFVHPQFPGVRVEINDLGMRDGLDEKAPPDPDDVSVLVLGDSFVFGTGVEVEDTFHELLEARAAEITPHPLRVYGAGLPGISAFEERKQLAALQPKIQPDVVILGVFEGNDFDDNWRAEVNAGAIADHSSGSAPNAASRFEQFIGGVLRFRFWAASSSTVQVTRLDATLVRWGLIDPLTHSSYFLVRSFLSDPPAVVGEMRDLLIRRLGEIRAFCSERGAELVILTIPDSMMVDARLFDVFAAEQSDGDYSRVGFHRGFVERLRQEGFHVVDTLPQLEADTVAGKACYHAEGHWNQRGHAIAAELLAPVLAEILAGR